LSTNTPRYNEIFEKEKFVVQPQLVVIGSCNVDMVTRVGRIPAPGETVTGGDLSVLFGGKGANQAVMAARLGASVHMIGSIGRDSFGDDVVRNFERESVHISFLARSDRATGVALIAVDEHTGQNSIVVAPGANSALTVEQVEAAADVIRHAGAVVAQLETPVQATIRAFQIARVASVVTVFNPAPANTFPDTMFALCDVMTPNEYEAALITGSDAIHSTDDAIKAARAIQSRGAKAVIITLGSRGALLLDGNGQVAQLSAEKVQAVDSTGAGDAFTGALAFGLARGDDLYNACQRAIKVATMSVLKPGAMVSFPYAAEVGDLFA